AGAHRALLSFPTRRSSDLEQEQLFVTQESLRNTGGHPFYEALNRVLKKNKFDRFVEDLCQPFYARKMGRPGVPPGVYFRCLLVRSEEHTSELQSRENLVCR